MDQLTPLLSLFLIVFIGFFAGKFKFLPEESSKILNAFLFKVAVPAITFVSLAEMSWSTLKESPAFIIFNTLFLIVFMSVAFLILRLVSKDRKVRGSLMYTFHSGNTFYFGLPILLSIFGQEYFNFGILFVTIVITITDLVAFFILELDRKTKGETKSIDNIKDFLLNPIVIASFLGLIFLLVGIPIPEIFSKSLNALGGTVSTLALFALGIRIAYSFKLSNPILAIVSCTVKLVVLPAIMLLVLSYFEILSPVAMTASIVLTAMPSAIFSLVISEMFDLDKDLTTTSVMLSSVLFLLTSSFWVYFLGNI